MIHALSILVYAASSLGVVVLGRWPRSRVPSVEQLLGKIMSTRTGRTITLAFWVWIGWHFFAR